MVDRLPTGLALGLLLYPVLDRIGGRVAGVGLALALAAGAAGAFLLPAAWVDPVRSLALGAFLLWLGWRVAHPVRPDAVAEGLRTWGWITFAFGAFTLLSAFWG